MHDEYEVFVPIELTGYWDKLSYKRLITLKFVFSRNFKKITLSLTNIFTSNFKDKILLCI